MLIAVSPLYGNGEKPDMEEAGVGVGCMPVSKATEECGKSQEERENVEGKRKWRSEGGGKGQMP